MAANDLQNTSEDREWTLPENERTWEPEEECQRTLKAYFNDMLPRCKDHRPLVKLLKDEERSLKQNALKDIGQRHFRPFAERAFAFWHMEAKVSALSERACKPILQKVLRRWDAATHNEVTKQRIKIELLQQDNEQHERIICEIREKLGEQENTIWWLKGAALVTTALSGCAHMAGKMKLAATATQQSEKLAETKEVLEQSMLSQDAQQTEKLAETKEVLEQSMLSQDAQQTKKLAETKEVLQQSMLSQDAQQTKKLAETRKELKQSMLSQDAQQTKKLAETKKELQQSIVSQDAQQTKKLAETRKELKQSILSQEAQQTKKLSETLKQIAAAGGAVRNKSKSKL